MLCKICLLGILITSTGFSKTVNKKVTGNDDFSVCLEKSGLTSLEPKYSIYEIKQKREKCYLEVFGPKLKVLHKNHIKN